jgi:O-antigen/teichoic acid export membrane protein
MRLGDHMGKGLWALADKSLPLLYGIAFMLLVIRGIPASEFGNYALIQAAYLIAVGLATTFSYTPMLRFIFEPGSRDRVKSGALGLHVLFAAGYLCLFLPAARPLGGLFHSDSFAALAPWVPALLAASVARVFSSELCRADLRVPALFTVNATFFGVTLAGLLVFRLLGRLDAAGDVLRVNLLGELAGSCAGLALVRRDLLRGWSFSRSEMARMLGVGKYSVGVSLTTLAYTRLDVFLISGFLGPVQVAVYGSAQVFTRVYDLYRQVANTLFSPVVSRLGAQGRHDEVRVVFEKGVVFSLFLLLVPLVLFLAGAPLLFRLFYGDRYPEGVGLLQTFAAFAPVLPWQVLSGFTLMLVGSPRRAFLARLVGVTVGIAASVILIPALGPRGAILATLSAFLVQATWVTYEVRKLVGFTARGLLGRPRDAWTFARGLLLRAGGPGARGISGGDPPAAL